MLGMRPRSYEFVGPGSCAGTTPLPGSDATSIRCGLAPTRERGGRLTVVIHFLMAIRGAPHDAVQGKAADTRNNASPGMTITYSVAA